MQNVVNAQKVAKNVKNVKDIVNVADTIKGTRFIGLQNYLTERGEIANYQILVGASRQNMLKKDLDSLIENKKTAVAELLKFWDIVTVETAFKKIFESLETRLLSEEEKEKLREQGNATLKASDAQKDAYRELSTGVKLHLETLEVHIAGYEIKKTVVQAAPEEVLKKPDTRKDLTKCQDKLKSLCNFKNEKFRTFKISQVEWLKMQGQTL